MTTATFLADERYWQELAGVQMRRERRARAELLNGRLAMLGFVALLGTEALLHQGLLTGTWYLPLTLFKPGSFLFSPGSSPGDQGQHSRRSGAADHAWLETRNQRFMHVTHIAFRAVCSGSAQEIAGGMHRFCWSVSASSGRRGQDHH